MCRTVPLLEPKYGVLDVVWFLTSYDITQSPLQSYRSLHSLLYVNVMITNCVREWTLYYVVIRGRYSRICSVRFLICFIRFLAHICTKCKVSFWDRSPSAVRRRRLSIHIFLQTTSPPKPINQIQNYFTGMFLGWISFKLVQSLKEFYSTQNFGCHGNATATKNGKITKT